MIPTQQKFKPLTNFKILMDGLIDEARLNMRENPCSESAAILYTLRRIKWWVTNPNLCWSRESGINWLSEILGKER